MKWYLLAFALVLTTGCGVVTVPDNTVKAQKPAVPYDAALAQELGADDYGMRSYVVVILRTCLLYTSPSPRDATLSRMPSSA